MSVASIFQRRYPVRVLLLTLIVSLLVATIATVGAVAYVSLKGAIDELSSHRFAEMSGATADKVRNLLEPADDILMECETLASRGLLPIDDQDALGERLVERLRYNPKLTWLSYSDRDGRFTGAHRADDGSVLLNRSWITTGERVSMIEQIMSVGGVRVLARQSDDWKYDPRTKPFYLLAVKTPDHPVWTEPYEWAAQEGLGITCAYALRDVHGAIKGVFTADFRLDRLSNFLRTLQLGHTGRVAVITLEGKIIADPVAGVRAATEQRDPLVAAAMSALPHSLVEQHAGPPERVAFEYEGARQLAAFETFSMPNLDWATVIIVPERELLGSVRRNTIWTVGIGLVSLLLAVVLSNRICARFARPLQLISADLARIGRFEITTEALPMSRVKEIAVVSEATARMKTSLRSFGRYVPTDIVRELVALGEEAKLGAQSRALTIVFADIQGFTKISESLHPQQLVELLGAYFDAMSQVISWQQGTLDKFIGDGFLAFFNAPAPLPDHAARACRAALACHAELSRLRPRWQAKGWPPFRTRIGLHSAEVLVGNIGTPSRFAYTVIGDGVNLASGLESLNKVYGTEILASESTRDGAGAGFEWRRVDRVAVKGRARVGFVYELLGESAGMSTDVLRARDRYESAVDAYLRRQFAKAIEGFEESISLRPDDQAAQTMLARAVRLLNSPPTDEWDSVYTHAPG